MNILECVKKTDAIECFYFTKEDKDKILDYIAPTLNKDFGFEITETELTYRIKHISWADELWFWFDHWHVKTEYLRWEWLTEKEFKKRFQLVEE